MLVIVKRLKKVRGKYFLSLNKNIMKFFNGSFQKRNLEFFGAKLDTNLILLRVSNKVNTIQSNITSVIASLRYNKDRMNSYWVEIYKKYSIPFACIIFILIGAPLGTMTRKGGFGYSAGISLIFFLIYWAFLIGGEKLSDRGMLSPFWGMWSANVFLGILGILFTIKSARDRVTIKFNVFKKLIPKQWRLSPEDN
jgi:lipopolysaccharide export system permease protein